MGHYSWYMRQASVVIETKYTGFNPNMLGRSQDDGQITCKSQIKRILKANWLKEISHEIKFKFKKLQYIY